MPKKETTKPVERTEGKTPSKIGPDKTDTFAAKTVSVKEVLAAGGANKYALTKGVDPRKANPSGVVRVSLRETSKLLAMLRKQG